VILRSDAQEVWLSGGTESAKELLTPFPASEMTSHAVGYKVNHTKIDDESLLTPVEPNLGVTRRLF
jgi:putative SOS response-associated peptidase YedK